jgi:8-oxo-dGTP pyrophosphatase MutT (NUDIX family)
MRVDLLKSFAEFLTVRLKTKLPGKEAHLCMVPKIRLTEFTEIPAENKKSAVLLLLYPSGRDVSTVLIQRPVYEGYHSGQIALPGGKFQEEDINIIQTALREAWEEVGIVPGKINIIGLLSELFIPPSNFMLTPVIAFTNERPDFKIEPREVSELIEVTISEFSDKNLKEKEITLHSGRVVETPFYDIHGHVVWGATGMIMREFAILLTEFTGKK